METVRVDLPDGNTAELYAFMKHKTQVAVEEVTRQYLTYPEGAGKLQVSQGDDGGLAVRTKVPAEALEVTVDLDRINWTAVTEIIILNQVASWSLGEVTAEVLAEQSEIMFAALKTKVNAFYQGTFPLPGSGGVNLAKGLPLLSRFRRIFAFRRN